MTACPLCFVVGMLGVPLKSKIPQKKAGAGNETIKEKENRSICSRK